MSIKEKLEFIRNICRERESCFASGTGEKDCTYYKNCCFPTGYPVDWSDAFIAQLSSQLERPKARWEFAQMYYLTNSKRYHCSICGTSLLFDESKWKYCPNCGAEMEE